MKHMHEYSQECIIMCVCLIGFIYDITLCGHNRYPLTQCSIYLYKFEVNMYETKKIYEKPAFTFIIILNNIRLNRCNRQSLTGLLKVYSMSTQSRLKTSTQDTDSRSIQDLLRVDSRLSLDRLMVNHATKRPTHV